MKTVRASLLFLLLAVAFASQAARILWIDDPQKSDVIVVLAGETTGRPARGLELLRQGMAPRLWIDVVRWDQVFDHSLADIAQDYVTRVAKTDPVKLCVIEGLSTTAETADVKRCIQPLAPHRVLLVTSPYHTRRALTIFRHQLPEYEFSVAAVHDPNVYGTAWWTRREWAKATFEEWTKFFWWEAVDRWRTTG